MPPRKSTSRTSSRSQSQATNRSRSRSPSQTTNTTTRKGGKQQLKPLFTEVSHDNVEVDSESNEQGQSQPQEQQAEVVIVPEVAPITETTKPRTQPMIHLLTPADQEQEQEQQEQQEQSIADIIVPNEDDKAKKESHLFMTPPDKNAGDAPDAADVNGSGDKTSDKVAMVDTDSEDDHEDAKNKDGIVLESDDEDDPTQDIEVHPAKPIKISVEISRTLKPVYSYPDSHMTTVETFFDDIKRQHPLYEGKVMALKRITENMKPGILDEKLTLFDAGLIEDNETVKIVSFVSVDDSIGPACKKYIKSIDRVSLNCDKLQNVENITLYMFDQNDVFHHVTFDKQKVHANGGSYCKHLARIITNDNEAEITNILKNAHKYYRYVKVTYVDKKIAPRLCLIIRAKETAPATARIIKSNDKTDACLLAYLQSELTSWFAYIPATKLASYLAGGLALGAAIGGIHYKYNN
jgi:hypothetical protein